jgi:hypothetical protein
MLSLSSWRRSRRLLEEDFSETNDRLLGEKDEDFDLPGNQTNLYLKFVFTLSFLLNVILLFALFYARARSLSKDPFQQLYSECSSPDAEQPLPEHIADNNAAPLRDFIQYRQQIFTTPIPEEENEYVGPSTPERDAIWKTLYPPGNTVFTRVEASRLHNKTVAGRPDNGEEYPVVLNVFHDLHCLVRPPLRLPLLSPRNSRRCHRTVYVKHSTTSTALTGTTHTIHIRSRGQSPISAQADTVPATPTTVSTA